MSRTTSRMYVAPDRPDISLSGLIARMGCECRWVLGHDQFAISESGRLFNYLRYHPFLGFLWELNPSEIIATTYGRDREYRAFKTRVHGASVTLPVHRTLLMAFVGPCPQGKQASHLNDCGTDNRLCNLAWETSKENVFRRKINGGQLVGERSNLHKLSEDQVINILSLLGLGTTIAEITRIFNVSRACIEDIRSGSTWGFLSNPNYPYPA